MGTHVYTIDSIICSHTLEFLKEEAICGGVAGLIGVERDMLRSCEQTKAGKWRENSVSDPEVRFR